jgi:hypothetical protein
MSVVSLEAFEHNLRGKRTVWLLPVNSEIEFPPGFDQQILSENPPFQRKILLVSPKSSESWRYIDLWDIILTIHTNQDWSLALTQILYQPNPCIVCTAPEVIIPQVVIQKIANTRQDIRPTLVQFKHLAFDITILTADAVVFPKVSTDTEIDIVYNFIQHTSTEHSKQTKQVIKDILRDTRSAGAGIIVSSIGEVLGRASLYWYYTTQINKSYKVKNLSCIINTILSRQLDS